MRLIADKTYYNKKWYNSYRCMMDRCYRKNSANYLQYGGRGIKVCKEWFDIQNFEKWEKEHPFTDGMTLDRIDPNGDYEPNNCRWATRFEQANNRRNTIKITYNNKTHTVSEWAKITGINRSTINNRFWRGYPVDKIFIKGDLRKWHA